MVTCYCQKPSWVILALRGRVLKHVEGSWGDRQLALFKSQVPLQDRAHHGRKFEVDGAGDCNWSLGWKTACFHASVWRPMQLRTQSLAAGCLPFDG